MEQLSGRWDWFEQELVLFYSFDVGYGIPQSNVFLVNF